MVAEGAIGREIMVDNWVSHDVAQQKIDRQGGLLKRLSPDPELQFFHFY